MGTVEKKMTAVTETKVDLVVNGEPYVACIWPQWTLQYALAERVGLTGTYRTGSETAIDQGKPVVEVGGKQHLRGPSIRVDDALVCAHRGGRHGNLWYRGCARHLGPAMAACAASVIAEMRELLDAASLGTEVPCSICAERPSGVR